MTRIARARAQIVMLKALEKPFAKAIVAEKKRYLAAEIQSWVNRREFSPSLLQAHQNNLLAIYTKHGTKVVVSFGKFTAGGMKCGCEWCMETKDGVGIAATAYGKLARSWIGKHGAVRVKDVAQTTRNDLRRALLRAEDDALSAQETEQALKAVANLSVWRAATIARTEAHNAGMFASQGIAEQIASDTGAELRKEWVAVTDERTRMSHADADGQIVDLNSSFSVGGEQLEYPSDPSGSAENIINCRCVQGFIEAD